ncbi:hypothetical protein ACLI1A_07935 [Flavobacterium sp. RHBU_3]|uniref:hypothetical protein n=1 Tax=Flavobacterium sp. RHBU_3 TaxID=3391184 RepID=UPI0039853862
MPTNKISIPTPCHEKLDTMSLTDKGRYCTSCRKEVIDFTNMCDSDVLKVIRENPGGCGTFLPSQLNRNLEALPKKGRWQAAAIAVGMLSIASPVMAQQNMEPTIQTEAAKSQDSSTDTSTKNEPFTLRGIAVDEEGEPLKHIKVAVLNGKTTSTNRKGEFKIKVEDGDLLLFYYNRRIGATMEIISRITTVVTIPVKTTMYQLSGRYF